MCSRRVQRRDALRSASGAAGDVGGPGQPVSPTQASERGRRRRCRCATGKVSSCRKDLGPSLQNCLSVSVCRLSNALALPNSNAVATQLINANLCVCTSAAALMKAESIQPEHFVLKSKMDRSCLNKNKHAHGPSFGVGLASSGAPCRNPDRSSPFGRCHEGQRSDDSSVGPALLPSRDDTLATEPCRKGWRGPCGTRSGESRFVRAAGRHPIEDFPCCCIHCPFLLCALTIVLTPVYIAGLWPGVEMETDFDTFLEARQSW